MSGGIILKLKGAHYHHYPPGESLFLMMEEVSALWPPPRQVIIKRECGGWGEVGGPWEADQVQPRGPFGERSRRQMIQSRIPYTPEIAYRSTSEYAGWPGTDRVFSQGVNNVAAGAVLSIIYQL